MNLYYGKGEEEVGQWEGQLDGRGSCKGVEGKGGESGSRQGEASTRVHVGQRKNGTAKVDSLTGPAEAGGDGEGGGGRVEAWLEENGTSGRLGSVEGNVLVLDGGGGGPVFLAKDSSTSAIQVLAPPNGTLLLPSSPVSTSSCWEPHSSVKSNLTVDVVEVLSGAMPATQGMTVLPQHVASVPGQVNHPHELQPQSRDLRQLSPLGGVQGGEVGLDSNGYLLDATEGLRRILSAGACVNVGCGGRGGGGEGNGVVEGSGGCSVEAGDSDGGSAMEEDSSDCASPSSCVVTAEAFSGDPMLLDRGEGQASGKDAAEIPHTVGIEDDGLYRNGSQAAGGQIDVQVHGVAVVGAAIKKVRWMDRVGKPLVEVREFEPSDEEDSSDEDAGSARDLSKRCLSCGHACGFCFNVNGSDSDDSEDESDTESSQSCSCTIS